MADQGNSTSSSSEYSDERAARPAPGTNEYFNEMIYCTCKRCQNRKLKKRRLVGIHRLNYGVYIEETLPVPNILEEPMDVIDDSHSQDEEQDTFMDETTSQINEAGVNEFTMTVHEGISRVSPPRMHLVGMQNPIMPSDTPNVMQKDVSRRCVMPSTSRLETPITRVASSTIPHSMPSTSNMDAPSILVEMDMHASVRSTSQINNPSSLGLVRILPPTLEPVFLRSLIESQSRILRLLPETLENVEIRKEILKQNELWERTLLGSVGLTSDKNIIDDYMVV